MHPRRRAPPAAEGPRRWPPIPHWCRPHGSGLQCPRPVLELGDGRSYSSSTASASIVHSSFGARGVAARRRALSCVPPTATPADPTRTGSVVMGPTSVHSPARARHSCTEAGAAAPNTRMSRGCKITVTLAVLETPSPAHATATCKLPDPGLGRWRRHSPSEPGGSLMHEVSPPPNNQRSPSTRPRRASESAGGPPRATSRCDQANIRGSSDQIWDDVASNITMSPREGSGVITDHRCAGGRERVATDDQPAASKRPSCCGALPAESTPPKRKSASPRGVGDNAWPRRSGLPAPRRGVDHDAAPPGTPAHSRVSVSRGAAETSCVACTTTPPSAARYAATPA